MIFSFCLNQMGRGLKRMSPLHSGVISISARVRQVLDPSNGDINGLTSDRRKCTPPPESVHNDFLRYYLLDVVVVRSDFTIFWDF